jgi:hypothetical protein
MDGKEMTQPKNQTMSDSNLAAMMNWCDHHDNDELVGAALTWMAQEVDTTWRREISRRRGILVRRMRANGKSYQSIADSLNVSRQRAQQLAAQT